MTASGDRGLVQRKFQSLWQRWRAALTAMSFLLSGAIGMMATSSPGPAETLSPPNRIQKSSDPLASRFGGPFSLTSADGAQVTEQTFRGRYMLIYFGYTHCPDICPTGLATMTAAMDQLGDQAHNLQPIFISVDPARDTAQHLKAYGQSFHPKIVMLTGAETEVAAVAKAYRVHRRKYLWKADATSRPDDYGVDHGSLMYLMGPDGKFRTLFPHGTDVEKLTRVLRRYLAEEPVKPAIR